jgi:phospholipid/cholesterol/gamma-HCH transport system substrate-binding protein
MERHANYALVGAVSLGLFVGLVAFVVWLAGFQFTKKFDVYDVVFVGPVTGLSEGGEVHFNGIKVGEVTQLALDPTDPNRVIARVRLTAGVPVRSDSYATLEPLGITGVNYIQITGGSQGRPMLLSVTPKDTIPVIHSQKGTLAGILEGGGTVLQRAVQSLDRVNRLLSDENIASFTATLKDLRSVADEARERRAILADAQKTLQDVDKTANSINELTQSSNQLVNTDGRRALSNIADASQEMKATAREAREMMGKLRGPTSDFANTGLPQLTATIANLQQTARTLDGLAREVRESPRQALSKPPAKDIKVNP